MKNRLITAIVLLLFTLTFVQCVIGQAVQRSSFGQFCNETTKCDKGGWLTCQSSICKCIMENMVYDQARAKCVSRSGERCKFQLSDLTADKVGLALYENTDCVANAHCANGFTCSCAPGYYETVDGYCQEQKEFNATCVSSAECKESKLLFCIEGQCLCASDREHIYAKSNNDSIPTMCVGKAGKRLSGDTSCVEGTVLEMGVCKCTPAEDFYAGEDGRCYEKKDLDATCSKDAECKFAGKFLTCVNGKCGCRPENSVFQNFEKLRVTESTIDVSVYGRARRNPLGHNSSAYIEYASEQVVYGIWVSGQYHGTGTIRKTVYKSETDVFAQCVGLARRLCNPDGNCVKNSTCSGGICVCDNTFSPTSTGTCGVGHGQPCSRTTPCSDAFVCTNGVCNCAQIRHQQYSSTLQKCLGISSSFCSENAECLPNSVCEFNKKSEQKQCRCEPNFVPNGNGRCERAWNTTCDYGDFVPCDSAADLECRNGICSCPDTLTSFDPTLRKCLGLVGSRCDAQDGPQCVHGAICVQNNPKVAGECECAEGLKLNGTSCSQIVTERDGDSAPLDTLKYSTTTTTTMTPMTTTPTPMTSSPSTTTATESTTYGRRMPVFLDNSVV